MDHHLTEIETAQLVLEYLDEKDRARKEQLEILLRARAKRTVNVIRRLRQQAALCRA